MQGNKVVINILLVIIMILVVIACLVSYMCFTNDVEIIETMPEQALFSKEKYPKIDGSTSILSLAEAFKAEFTQTDIKDVEVKHSNNHNAYINLINGNTDLILVTYPSEEEQKLAKDKGIELEIVPVVKDAFVFFVNKNNPVENLTLSQIQKIYSGEIKNWSNVGGNNSEIIAFQKSEKSTSQIGMMELVMKGIKLMQPPTEIISQGMVDIVDIVSDYDNGEKAIGYSYYYYSMIMYTKNNMKLLSIDGIKPTYENIKTGLYDLQTTYYAVIKKDETENSDARKLLNAMISEEGQNVAREAGYVQNY